MTKSTLFTLVFLFVASTIFGQFIQEGNRSFSKGSYNSLSMELRETDKKTVEKEFAKKLDNYKGKTKTDKKSGEIFSDNAVVKELSNNDMDIYAKVTQSGSNTVLTVWFDLGGAYLSSEQHPKEYAFAEKMIMEFAISVSKGMLEDQLKTEEKTMKNLEGDLKKLKKDKEGYEKDIEKAKQLIAERENDIKVNIEEQKAKDGEIQTQSGVINTLKTKISKLN